MNTQNWIAIIGSPRRAQNTEKLTDIVIGELKNKGIEVKKYYLDKRQMSPCSNCEYCLTQNDCNISDEISEIINELIKADGVILASPSYNYNVSSQMKIFLDRTFVLNDYTSGKWKPKLKSGKKAIVLGVCKGPNDEFMGHNTEAMRKSIDELGVEVVDIINYYNVKSYPVGSNDEKINEVRMSINKIDFK